MDTGLERKRGNVARSETLRERIEDYLMRSGGRDSRDRYEALREDFIVTAIRTAEREGRRLWKADDPHKVQYNARRSLQVLFGEVENVTYGTNGSGARKRTGVNVSWVLDVWERALNVLNREDVFTREQRRQEELKRGSTDFGPPAEPADGPQVFKIVADKPISVRILDAYLNRDDEAMMRLAVEIEGLELAV